MKNDCMRYRQLHCRCVVLARVCNEFDRMQALFIRSGFAPFEASYYASWLHSGQRVSAQVSGSGDEELLIEMTVKGLSPSGALVAVDMHGNRHELFPDGNSFDFLIGLVSRKSSRV